MESFDSHRRSGADIGRGRKVRKKIITLVMATAAHARLSLLLRKAWYSSESRGTGAGVLGKTAAFRGGAGAGLG